MMITVMYFPCVDLGGHLTYKTIPFGSMEDVLPNMSRRAVENKTVFHRLQQEKKMLRRELSRRTLSSSQ